MHKIHRGLSQYSAREAEAWTAPNLCADPWKHVARLDECTERVWSRRDQYAAQVTDGGVSVRNLLDTAEPPMVPRRLSGTAHHVLTRFKVVKSAFPAPPSLAHVSHGCVPQTPDIQRGRMGRICGSLLHAMLSMQRGPEAAQTNFCT